MKRNKLLIPLALLLSSCYTQKKAVKHIAQAQAQYPEVVRAACVNYYPSKDSVTKVIEYKQGRTDTFIELVETIIIDTVIKQDTLLLDGEVFYKENLITKEIKVKVPCPTTAAHIDTYTNTVYNSFENTAVVAILTDRVDSLNEVVIVTKERLKTAKKRIYIMTIGLIMIIATLALAIAAKKYFKL